MPKGAAAMRATDLAATRTLPFTSADAFLASYFHGDKLDSVFLLLLSVFFYNFMLHCLGVKCNKAGGFVFLWIYWLYKAASLLVVVVFAFLTELFAAHVALSSFSGVALHIPNCSAFFTFFRLCAETAALVILIAIVVDECFVAAITMFVIIILRET